MTTVTSIILSEFSNSCTSYLLNWNFIFLLLEKAILKAQDGAKYSYLEGEELQNFGVAVQMYYEQVMRGVYKRDPKTGQKFSNWYNRP